MISLGRLGGAPKLRPSHEAQILYKAELMIHEEKHEAQLEAQRFHVHLRTTLTSRH